MRFSYEVKADLPLTGMELRVLEYAAQEHYDGVCRRFFQGEDQSGARWLAQWRAEGLRVGLELGHERRSDERLELQTTISVSSKDLNKCLKILESWPTPSSWEGLGLPATPDTELVGHLRKKLQETYTALQTESNRLYRAP